MWKMASKVMVCMSFLLVACSDPVDAVDEDAGGDLEVHVDVEEGELDVELDGEGDADISGESDADGPDADGPDADDPDADGPDADGLDANEPDADSSSEDGGSEDAGSEEDPYEGRPIGQCVVSADCPDVPLGSGMCSRALPGGACTGCGNDTHCPSIASCEGTNCVGDCSTTEDCAPGLSCNSQSLCVAMVCVGGECPVPFFGCSESLDRCERIDCSEDASVCPEETTCVSGRCIEDRAL